MKAKRLAEMLIIFHGGSKDEKDQCRRHLPDDKRLKNVGHFEYARQ